MCVKWVSSGVRVRGVRGRFSSKREKREVRVQAFAVICVFVKLEISS